MTPIIEIERAINIMNSFMAQAYSDENADDIDTVAQTLHNLLNDREMPQ